MPAALPPPDDAALMAELEAEAAAASPPDMPPVVSTPSDADNQLVADFLATAACQGADSPPAAHATSPPREAAAAMSAADGTPPSEPEPAYEPSHVWDVWVEGFQFRVAETGTYEDPYHGLRISIESVVLANGATAPTPDAAEAAVRARLGDIVNAIGRTAADVRQAFAPSPLPVQGALACAPTPHDR